MADDNKTKQKRNRSKGGYALVELVDGEGGAKVLELVTRNLDTQEACKKDLKEKIESGEIEANGERTFGIVQVKTLDLCPKTETKVKVTW